MFAFILLAFSCVEELPVSTDLAPEADASDSPAKGGAVNEASGKKSTPENAATPGEEQEGSADGGAPSAQPAPPDGAGAGDGVNLSGTVIADTFAGGLIQLDAVAEVDGQSQVVAMERLEAPGAFTLDIRGGYAAVDLVAYLDAAGDGPGGGDARFSFSQNPIDLTAEGGIEGLVFSLDADAAHKPPTEGEGDAPSDATASGDRAATP